MIEVSVNKVTYDDIDTGFHIAKMNVCNKSEIPSYVKLQDGCITVKGYFPVNTAIKLKIDGQWEKSTYGYQFIVESFQEIIPHTERDICSYLSSCCEIPIKLAVKIVKQFGLNTVEVFENEPEKLLYLKGITRKDIEKCLECYRKSRTVQQVVSYLTPLGISTKKCMQITNSYGEKSMDVITNKPFELCEVKGFNFVTVDEIAKKTVFALNDALRIKAGIKYVLENAASSEGHMCLNQCELLCKSYLLLNSTDVKYEALCSFLQKNSTHSLKMLLGKETVTFAEVLTVFKQMAVDGTLKGDNGFAYLATKYEQECDISTMLINRLNYQKDEYSVKKEKIFEEIAKSERRNGIKLATQQKAAIVMGVKENTCIITGGPGTGKTTVLKLVLEVCQKFLKLTPEDVTLLAPTGRAASRMSDSVGSSYKTSTIHAALHITGDDNISFTNAIDSEIVVVDEVSMVDSYIAWCLLKAVPCSSKLILIGDAEQLPSVGAGNVLYELLKSKQIPTVKLETIYRQSGTNSVAINDDLIKRGITNLRYDEKFRFIPVSNTSDFDKNDKERNKKIQSETAKIVIQEFLAAVENEGLDNVQVLCPVKKKGVLAGATELNKAIQDQINPHSSEKGEIKRGAKVFRVGDKVIQTQNNYNISWEKADGECGEGIFNGDVGYIQKIDNDVVVIDFEGKKASYDVTQLSDIELAYVISIHKSQGSEYKTAIIPIITAFAIMLKRNLIHTGVSRAKNKIVLVGQQKAIDMAIRNNSIAKRNTQLAKRIIDNNLKENYL